jgi:hypothetical protein
MEEVRFTNGGVTLVGTVYLPRRRGPQPAVVFVHGSGGEGRSGQNRFLADRFARRGMAALFFDKRGVGASTGDWRLATFDDLAADVQAGLALLRARADIAADRIGLFGSSEGAGYIAPLVASNDRGVAWLVLKSGPFVAPPEQYLFEDDNALRAQGFHTTAVGEALAFRRLIFETAITRDWTRFDAEVRRVQEAPWFDYMRPGPRDFWWWNWWVSVARFDPRPVLAQIRVPLLALFGAADQVVSVAAAQRNFATAMQQAGNRHFQIRVFPGADHALYVQPSVDGAWPRFPVEYPDEVLDWVVGVVGLAPSARR